MDSYEIRNSSNIQVQILDTLPAFSATTDQGRIIFVTDTGGIYFGTTSAWKRIDTMIGHDSGTSYPTDTEAGMLFYNTSTANIYMRNSTNTGWVLIASYSVPLDARDAAGFSAQYLDTYAKTSFGTSLSVSGNTIRLHNSDGTVLSTVTMSYAASVNNTLALDGVSYSDLYNITGQGVTYLTQGSSLYNYVGPNSPNPGVTSPGYMMRIRLGYGAGWAYHDYNNYSDAGY